MCTLDGKVLTYFYILKVVTSCCTTSRDANIAISASVAVTNPLLSKAVIIPNTNMTTCVRDCIHLQDQCVHFRRIYWHKLIVILGYVLMCVQSPKSLCFLYLSKSPFYIKQVPQWPRMDKPNNGCREGIAHLSQSKILKTANLQHE